MLYNTIGDLMRSKLLNFKRTILLFIRIMNLAVLTAIFAYIWYTYYSDPVLPGAAIEFFRKGNWLIIIIYSVLLGAFTQLNGGYKVGDYRISEMIYSNVISIIFINFIYYFLIALMWRAFPEAEYLLLLSVIQFAYILIWCIFSNKFYFKLYRPRKVIYFYQSNTPSIVLDKMYKRYDKYDVKDVFRIFDAIDFNEYIAKYDAVVLDRVDANTRAACIEACYSNHIRLYMVPSFDDVIIESSMMINLLDTPLYLMKNRGLSFEQLLLKRALDLIISIPMALITSPIMLLAAVSIKLDDHGPIFYCQERLTLDGKIFKILKFRSMHEDAEKDGKPKLMCKDDDRITRVGRVIRKCRIDELPQLLNVIKGDMSIVGPRPERPEIAEKYYKIMPEFEFRLNGKAGITGYAQVMGKYNTTPYDKLSFDLMYLENYSLLFDLKILLMTFKTIFKVDATEGIDE